MILYMEPMPLGRLISVRGAALVVAVMFIAWLLTPAITGYHAGHDLWTDHECLSRIIQWCR